MNSLVFLIIQIINLYEIVLIFYIILIWLVNFNVINTSNRLVFSIIQVLHNLCEPILRIIRRYIPNIGNIDISPLVVLILLWFIQNLLTEYWPR